MDAHGCLRQRGIDTLKGTCLLCCCVFMLIDCALVVRHSLYLGLHWFGCALCLSSRLMPAFSMYNMFEGSRVQPAGMYGVWGYYDICSAPLPPDRSEDARNTAKKASTFPRVLFDLYTGHRRLLGCR